MLSQLRLVDETPQAFKPLLPPPIAMHAPAPLLPSLRVQPPYNEQHQHHTYHAHHHHYSHHNRPPLPSLRASHPSVISPSSDSSHKCSLAFILSEPAATESTIALTSQSEMSSSSEADSVDNDPSDRPHNLKHKRRSGSSLASVGSKSKFCIVEGCTSRAKHARKCWRHGGSVKCKVGDCINRAKSRGVCWSHGGGTTCSHPNCGTIAVSHGFCWAHGGGKRCEVGGCSRPAYERTQNLCSTHFKQTKAANKAGPSRAAAPY